MAADTSITKLRWGILSTGNIAKTFARALPHSETGTLVAVASRAKEKADAFATEFGAARSYGSYEELLADGEVDAVYLATPHPQHAQWAIKAVRAGKHLLCEKPIGVNASQAMVVYDEAEIADVFCMEAFMYRCHPQTAKLVELVKSGEIGEVQVIDAAFTFRAGGDAPDYEKGRLFADPYAGGGILDVGCYTTSIARLVAGAAVGRPFLDPIEVTGSAAKAPNGVDEWAVGTLKFENNVLANLRTGVRLNGGSDVTIYGTKGKIELDNPFIPAKEGGRVVIKVSVGNETREEVIESDKWLYAHEADAFAKGVADKIAPYPAMSVDDSLGNLRTLDRWRAACGVTYSFETPAAYAKTTLAGIELKVAESARNRRLLVDGVPLAVSQMVMGVDNQARFDHAAALFDGFYEQGGNAFDTAIVYGRQRSLLLGEWLKLRGVRDECAIICKGAHTPNCYPDVIGRELATQLDWLQTDRCDLYFMHRDNLEVPVGEFVDAMNEQVDANRIRGVFGGSNWSLARVKEANEYAKINGKRGFGAVSQNFSLAEMVEAVWPGCQSAHEPAWMAWLEETQTPNFAWSSQARGFFVPERDLEEKELNRCWVSDANLERRRRCFELAERKNVDPINIAAAWVLGQTFPSFALIGPRTPRELRTSLVAFSVELSLGERAWLDLKTDSPV